MLTGGTYVSVVDRVGRPVLAAEAKSRFDTSRSWAAGTFRNLYVHGSIPEVPYFLLALPDVFYLWCDPGNKALKAFVDGETNAFGNPQVSPDYSVPSWEIVRPYLGHPGGRDPKPQDVSSYAMNLVLGAFLSDVLNARHLTSENALREWWWLFDSGLYPAMRGGTFAGAVAG